MTERMVPEPVGLRDISDRLGVPYDTVRGWRQRGLLEPFTAGKIAGRAVYDWRAVEAWYEETPPTPGRPRKGGDDVVVDPLGLVRCASCTNAFEYDRQPDGTCAHCGGRFDPPDDALT